MKAHAPRRPGHLLRVLTLCLDGNTLKVTGQIKVPGGAAGIRTVEK